MVTHVARLDRQPRVQLRCGCTNALDRWALGHVDAVVVVTRAMLKLPALRAIARRQVHLIENGIPALETRMADLALQGEPPRCRAA